MSTQPSTPDEPVENIFDPEEQLSSSAPAVAHRHAFPTATLVLGLVAIVVAVLVLGANLLNWTLDPAIVGVSLLAGAGFLMIIGGILTHRQSDGKA